MQKKDEMFFQKYDPTEVTDSKRILCTPSSFAKETLWYIQEIGTLKSLKPHTSQREGLDSYLFIIVLSGNGSFTYNGISNQLIPNDIVFIDCKNKYSHRSSSSDPWELVWVHFNGKLIENYYNLFLKKTESIFFSSKSVSELTNILFQIINMISYEDATSELLCSNLLNNLITKVLTLPEVNTKLISKSNYKKITKIKDYIDNNFQKKITLDKIAHDFYISKYHMSREFKQNYGITINNYITNKRTTLAKELLRFTDKSIKEVAQLCGINDYSYFNKVFKKVEKVPPSKYRKQWKGWKTNL